MYEKNIIKRKTSNEKDHSKRHKFTPKSDAIYHNSKL